MKLFVVSSMIVRPALTAGIAVLFSGCAEVAKDDRRAVVLPSFESFGSVSAPLEGHCGSLDCHGTGARNLRLYGWSGERLPPGADGAGDAGVPVVDPLATAAPTAAPPLTLPEFVPGGDAETTDEERWFNYLSVVSLQPEATSVVFIEKSDVGKLLLLSKGRGTEHHKGGSAMRAGDNLDLCVQSWLHGQVDEDACSMSIQEALEIPPDFMPAGDSQ